MRELSRIYGKIILIGEHSVVYGKPAIAMPYKGVELKVYIEKSDKNIISCKFFDGEIDSCSNEVEGIKELINEFFRKYSINEKIKIKIESTIPNERGMGSSAAASIGVAKALYEYFKIDYTDKDIKEIANISEKIIHGNPSGVDIEVICSEKSIVFRKGEPFENIDINIDAYLIIADTGIKGKTKEAVSDVKKILELNPEKFELIEKLGDCANLAKESILNNDIYTLGNVMYDSHEILKSLTVSDESLDILVDISKKNGAIGAKMTGGGRGGCMIALSDNFETAKKIKEELNKHCENTWMTYLKR